MNSMRHGIYGDFEKVMLIIVITVPSVAVQCSSENGETVLAEWALPQCVTVATCYQVMLQAGVLYRPVSVEGVCS